MHIPSENADTSNEKEELILLELNPLALSLWES